MPVHHVIIADEHPLFREALRQTLGEIVGGADISEASSLHELAVALQAHERVDLVLLDLTLPGLGGGSGVTSLRGQYPDLPIMAVSASEDRAMLRRLHEQGLAGFIAKSLSADVILERVSSVLEGGGWTLPPDETASESDKSEANLLARLATLTPQQVRVLTMLSEGLLNKQIAFELDVSEATVKAHVSAILQKLGVESRTQAVIAVNAIDGRSWQQACGVPPRS